MLTELGRRARAAQRVVGLASAEQKTAGLRSVAAAIRATKDDILSANAVDLAAANTRGQTAAFLDRLMLTVAGVELIAQAVEDIAALPDPVGRVLATFTRPNGLVIERVATPLGVIGVIFESRPNVTADAGALCLKAGNADDPARRLRQLSNPPWRSAAAWRGPTRRRPARGRDPARADARPRRRRRHADGPWRHDRRTSCRAAARASSRACRTKRAFRSSRISKASCTSMSIAPPISKWRRRSS